MTQKPGPKVCITSHHLMKKMALDLITVQETGRYVTDTLLVL